MKSVPEMNDTEFAEQTPHDRILDEVLGYQEAVERGEGCLPPSLIPVRDRRSPTVDPLEDIIVTDSRQAHALIVTMQFYQASQLQEVIHLNRIKTVVHGFSGAGTIRAMCDNNTLRQRMMRSDGLSPTFYLGPHTPVLLVP